MTAFEVYNSYLGIKNHFTKDNYDFYKYRGKTKSSLKTFYGRKDRFWFEKISRQKKDDEIVNFFVANFVSSDDPQRLWIGEIIKTGNERYVDWNKKIQSLSYFFRTEIENSFSDQNFDEMFSLNGSRHPKILKLFLSGKISLETLVILNAILNFGKRFDSNLIDPVWELTSFRMKKYSPFLNIDVSKFKDILKLVVVNQ
jgi:hypothetical protein